MTRYIANINKKPLICSTHLLLLGGEQQIQPLIDDAIVLQQGRIEDVTAAEQRGHGLHT